jgi:hypothetical protein
VSKNRKAVYANVIASFSSVKVSGTKDFEDLSVQKKGTLKTKFYCLPAMQE